MRSEPVRNREHYVSSDEGLFPPSAVIAASDRRDTSLPFLCDFERQGVSFVSYICVVLWFSFNPCITTPTLTSIVMIENSCSLSAV